MGRTKPIIVAEIGINHNGDIKMAKNLIALASNYGADYVKFQKKTPDVCVPENQKNIFKPTIFGPMRYIDYKKRMEFGKKEYDEIDKYCKLHNISWFASPWDMDSVDFLTQYDVPFIKVASASLTNIALLQKIKETNIPVIISRGMSTKKEIDKAIDLLSPNVRYLLHTNSSYPTPNTEMNMLAIHTLKERFGKDMKIGFSNHCIDLIYIIQAYVMGAEMLEFHITLDRAMSGTDQYASIGPLGFDRIIKHIDNIYLGWGDGQLTVQKSELDVKEKLRK